LCDDSFEEHVLAYPPERSGLHLHGLNVATKGFKTMSHDIVDSFAEEWGFIKTRTHIVNSIEEVRGFTSHVGEVGEWEGEAVEGFVVRTHVSEPPHCSKSAKGQLPYAPGSSFFFKIKFDEPYMMYRDWREMTKKLLSPKSALQASSLPKGKMKRKETQVYVKWIIEEIRKDRKQFDGYTKGHGIIATRERFLKWYEQQKISERVGEEDDRHLIRSANDRVIIVPVAVPGCGVFEALPSCLVCLL
jgi:tRNA ligase